MDQQDIRDLKVADISHAEWPTLRPDETVEGAIKLFAESGISGAPVVENGRLVGIVTEGDLIFRDADIKAPGFLDILGGFTISPEASLAEASTIMADKRVKILPVAEDDTLHGVITRMDILTLHVLNPHR
jgi:CBS domain-containing protein